MTDDYWDSPAPLAINQRAAQGEREAEEDKDKKRK